MIGLLKCMPLCNSSKTLNCPEKARRTDLSTLVSSIHGTFLLFLNVSHPYSDTCYPSTSPPDIAKQAYIFFPLVPIHTEEICEHAKKRPCFRKWSS